MPRLFVFTALILTSAQLWAQAPSPQKQTPQPQPPVTQMYRLVPVDTPVTQQYQTVQVQQPVTQQYQTVQMVQQPVQQVAYQAPMTGISTTVAATPTAQRTVVLGPGLVGLSVARVGQFLTGAGKTHVWTINHTAIRPVVNPAPPVSMVQVYQPQPVVQQQPTLVSLPQQVVQQPVYQINAPSESAPPPPVIGPPQTPPVCQTPPATPSPQAPAPTPATHKLMNLFH
jgi:hypothetical protein